ncbi:MAG: AMP-binding protein [Actinomycetota bacterium]|nr:AMP-binding protein [Actinomycetota bacterium]
MPHSVSQVHVRVPGVGVNANIAGFLRDSAVRNPDGVCLIDGDTHLTWREVDAAVDTFAAALIQRGLHAGDRVALMLGNSHSFVIAYYGILRAGLVAVPMNPAYTVAEVAVLLADSGARMLFVQESTHAVGEQAADALPSCEVVMVGDAVWQSLTTRDDTTVLVEAATPADALALLLFTAGTSGRPKGAMLTHGALRANVEALLDLKSPPAALPDDVVLLVLPMFHVYGLNTVLGLAVARGASIVVTDRFDPVESLAQIRRSGVTTVPGAPAMFQAWCRVPEAASALAGVRLFTSGGSPLPIDVQARFAEHTGHGIFEGYGMTETAPVVSTTLVSGAPKPGSVGRPLPSVEVRLVDEDGEPVDEGDPGDLWVRGPSVFRGYWPHGEGGPDSDGWFHSGDVAYADEDGDLHLVDRRREVILVNGFNVYPREIELVIDQVPGVVEAAVVGVPDDATGEAVMALVVAAPGASLGTEAIVDFCADRLARFKCPTSVRVVPALPHSATGKIAKGRLREVYGDAGFGA